MQFLKQARRRYCVAEIEEDVDKAVWSRQGLFMFAITSKSKGPEKAEGKFEGKGDANGDADGKLQK